MEDAKREMTIEELESRFAEISKERQLIEERLKQKKQEEEDRRTAQLALDKESRKKEVEEALEHYNKLIKAYIKDYGFISISDTLNDITAIFDPKDFRWWP